MDDTRPAKRQKRRAIACERCHSQKIRCSGEQPCQGCEIAKKPGSCRYPFRDRNVTIPESYLEKLESEIQELKARESFVITSQIAAPSVESPPDQVRQGHVAENDVPNPLLEVQDGLFAGQDSAQPVFIGEASCTAFGDRLLQCVDSSYSSVTCNTIPDHITHPAFNRLASKDFQLPNRVQATLLVRRAHSFIGNNYHLFEKKSFFDKLDRAYSGEGGTDLLFTCHLFAMLALGELYTHCKTNAADSRIPGTSYFVQAVNLLQDLYEVGSIEQVQILLLISFYANSLGRVKSAHVYCGIAVRIGIGLGLHRSQAGSSTMSPVQREVRRRVWWTLYLFDRMISSKLGYPLAIRDDDIDVEFPSMEGLSTSEQAEFCDPVHLRAHSTLAKITGSILSDIYRLPRQSNPSFVRVVHRVLNDLRQWDEELPVVLRLQGERPPRNLFTLHMQYHLCIIQTTRPILLHIFKMRLQSGLTSTSQQRQTFSPTTLALADACVQAARTTNQLLSKLFVEGSLAVFGYFDSHYLFSSTLILIISAVMEPQSTVSDAVQTAFSLLRSMASNGNISANDYLNRLEHIRSTVSSARAQADQRLPRVTLPNGDMEKSNHLDQGQAIAATSRIITNNDPPLWEPSNPMLSGDEFNGDDPLGNPFIESFLAEKAFQWPGGLSPEQDFLRQFAQELGDEFLFGS
ncbi:hypothetical protein M409DRAFT_67379 [Zasmidium cellare ATCC 36951]|uniref:Zn(2)-C6 fungal-type domain-containing protein n=1 Tax=Zasmidium cellare ATCC 36951 TaxID=1080233 RepID=A0A6A6CDB6_ZASCE|nr:uncharacterized protein M409DRAFT_67379 [Zasmidium cellare ATCC 36951]KAF2165085.1 hypothetical protein M409DRAFT_67379 [Zasmidium cellare ATCC 36951]